MNSNHNYIFFLLIAVVFAGCQPTEPQSVTEEFTIDADGNTHLRPPPPGEGMQIQLPEFEIAPGAEIQRDYYITLPNDEDYEVGKIQIVMNEGTHHMNFFRTAIPDSTIPAKTKKIGQVRYINNGKDTTQNVFYNDSSFFATSIFSESDILIEAQVAHKLFNWDLPKLENGKQATIKLRKNEPMILQIHYVNNASSGQETPNNKGKVSVNIWKAKDVSGGVEHASMLFARNQRIYVPPKSDVSFTKYCYLSNVVRPMYILGMTGHFHSRGKEFTVDIMKDSAGQRVVVKEKIYQSVAWAEPSFKTYGTEGFAKPIKLEDGEYIRYTCRYVNPNSIGYPFGPDVLTGEHSNLFMWFVPGWNDGATIYDTDG